MWVVRKTKFALFRRTDDEGVVPCMEISRDKATSQSARRPGAPSGRSCLHKTDKAHDVEEFRAKPARAGLLSRRQRARLRAESETRLRLATRDFVHGPGPLLIVPWMHSSIIDRNRPTYNLLPPPASSPPPVVPRCFHQRLSHKSLLAVAACASCSCFPSASSAVPLAPSSSG